MKKFKNIIAVTMAGVLICSMAVTQNIGHNSQTVFAAQNSTDKSIKVDINGTDGRKDAYSLLYDNWILNSSKKATETFGGIEFTLSNGGTTGGNIKGANYKRLIKSDFSTPRLTMDGAVISDATSGGVIKLEIKGLAEGSHTLTTWHSFFDNVTGSSVSVYVDGEKKISNIKVPTRVSDDNDAGIGFCEFNAKKGKTVTVLIVPDGNGEYDNAVLNAFEIDSVNPFKTISSPQPADGEMYFVQENGLSWKAGEGAVSHDVYLGTDYDKVYNADTASEEFKGNQTETLYNVSGLSHMQTYYWRVDEHNKDGVTKGEVMTFEVAHLAFPSAEGYGRFAKAGRGGRVIEVTNLNDSGEGSLRDAIENQKGPRVIVFKVGGVIELKSRLAIPADGGNVYVAGQTAPGDGITLTNYAFGIYYATDVVIRHVRLRVGDSCNTAMDGMGMAGADNSIIDHCSISWTTDEGTSSRGAHNITFQHNIIAEALNNSVHYDASDRDGKTERHSFAGSISGNIGSFHHNLLVDCTGRNWSLAGGMEQDGTTYAGQLDIRNNVIYNYKDRTTDGGVRKVNFVNNYYKQGAVSKNMKIFSIDGNELNTGDMQKAYVSGNKMVKKDGSVILDSNKDAWSAKKAGSKFNSVSDVKSDKPFFESYVNTQTADEAYESVISDVGANVPKQDYLDTRYINETKNGTYTYVGSKDGLKGIIDSQEDVGGYPKFDTVTAAPDSDHDGMPDEWESLHGLNPNNPEDRNGMQLSMEGYTNLEMYLDELANDKLIWNENPVITDSPVPTPTASESAAPSKNPAPTASESAVPTQSQSPAASESAAPSKSPAPTASESAVPTQSQSPTASESAAPTQSQSPAASESAAPTHSQTPTASESAAPNKSPAPTASESAAPTQTPTVSESPVPDKIKGDINLNGKIDLEDAVYALKIALGIKTDAENEMCADIDENGKVDLADTLEILKRALGISDSLQNQKMNVTVHYDAFKKLKNIAERI